MRVFEDNPTFVTEEEIDEFLKIVGDSTFAVVKINNANNSFFLNNVANVML